ncbi:hypothetical protein C8R46DRAFT_1361283 [Mycena filopes]|nr:hypothetical protein C8R46DRAFT_1361283 [Mycena filopes]
MPGAHHRHGLRVPAAAAAAAAVPTTKPVVVTTKKPVVPVKTTAKVVTTAKVPVTPTKPVVPVVPTTTKPIVPVTTPSLPVSVPIVSPSLPLTTLTSVTTPIAPLSTSSPVTTPSLTPSTPTTPSPSNTILADAGASASPSPSSSVSPTSSTSVTAVAAGVIGGLVGVIITGVIVAFFFRRWHGRRSRARGRESINFDPKSFRRSGVMLPEDPLPGAPRPFAHSSSSSVRSVPMDYNRPMQQQQGYPSPYMQPSPYGSGGYADTPGYRTPELQYPVQHAFYGGAGAPMSMQAPQDPMHMASAGYPPPQQAQAQAHHYPGPYHASTDDAYGGM